MGEIIAVVSGKGGTGKTTFVSSLGLALADIGKKTLALDCDIALKNLDLALGLSEKSLMDFGDVLSNRCTLENAVVTHDTYTKLDFLTAPSLNNNDKITVNGIEKLKAEIKSQYDFCLIDAPAGLGVGFELAIRLSDQVIIIGNIDASSLRDAQKTMMALQEFKDGSIHLVMNKINKKSIKAANITIDDAMDYIGAPLLGIIPEEPDIPAIINKGLPLLDYNYAAAKAVRNIAKRVLGIDVPLALN